MADIDQQLEFSEVYFFQNWYFRYVYPLISSLSRYACLIGHTRFGDELKELVEMAEQNKNGILLDEAYEFYHESGGVSGIEFVKDLENSNIFITGAATKGLQSPGIRVGWVVASKKNIETLSNFSSFGMGGVSHLSQLYAVKLLEKERLKLARSAVAKHFGMQRERYYYSREECQKIIKLNL